MVLSIESKCLTTISENKFSHKIYRNNNQQNTSPQIPTLTLHWDWAMIFLQKGHCLGFQQQQQQNRSPIEFYTARFYTLGPISCNMMNPASVLRHTHTHTHLFVHRDRCQFAPLIFCMRMDLEIIIDQLSTSESCMIQHKNKQLTRQSENALTSVAQITYKKS